MLNPFEWIIILSMLFDSNSLFRALILLGLLPTMSSLTGCDTLQSGKEKAPVNPYADITRTYSEATSAALKHAQRQHPTEIQKASKYMKEGYRLWINQNNKKAQDSFGDFQELRVARQSVQNHIAQSPRAKNFRALSVDSLLSVADLTLEQENRLQTLFTTLRDLDSFSEVEVRLNQFDATTIRQLDKKSRQVVLQTSALIRAHAHFIANAGTSTNSRLAFLATVNDSTDTKRCNNGSKTTKRG